MKKQLLIIGANGMLGQTLASTFTDRSPILWDLPDADITNADTLREKMCAIEGKIDYVINAAAYTAVDDAEEHEELATKVNGYAVQYLVDACDAIDAALVHYSTDYVFLGDRASGYDEQAERSPINAYGRSKAKGEELLLTKNAKHYLIRTAWLYGLHGANFVETMIKLGAEREELQVVDDQVGSPTYTVDLAEATKLLIGDEAPAGIYHLTNDGHCTWYEFAKEIFAQIGNPVRVQPVGSDAFPRPAKRPAFSVLLNTKRPKLPSWQDGLTRYLKTR